MVDVLFVYGTLRKGESNYIHIAPLVSDVSTGWYLFGTLYQIGPYTALALGGDQKIHGQLIHSNSMEEMLRVTDLIEGDEYKRVNATVYSRESDEASRLAAVYCYAGDVSSLRRLSQE